MKKLSILVFLMAILSFNQFVYPCSGFVVVNNELIFVGNNEDYGWRNVIVRIRPAEQGKYGCILVGFSHHAGSYGGMNEKGLFMDSFGLVGRNARDWTESPDKEYFTENVGNWFDYLFEIYDSVEEVVTFCKTYNLPYFGRGHLLVADRTGKSAIIEWGDGEVQEVRKQGDFQIVNNSPLYPDNYSTEWRFQRMLNMLNNNNNISFEFCASILNAVHVELSEENQTGYSNIYEIHNRAMSVFYHHNFDEFIKFNVIDEIAKGRREYLIEDHMSRIILGTPENDQIINPDNVEFTWNGKSDSQYLLYYSTDPDFTDCEPIEVARNYSLTFKQSNFYFIFAGIFSLGIAFTRKNKNILKIIPLLILLVLITQCRTHHTGNGENNNGNDEYRDFMVEVQGLEPNTTYYWKITANLTNQLTSESIVRKFTTE